MNKILDSLGLEASNAGTWYGSDSSENGSAPLIASINPASGETIASVRSTTTDEYERLVSEAQDSFREWRKLPAPVRGGAVRLIGEALRDNKDALGSLVTLEMGKIKAEGDGEVQEMIDIADFAVGLSRMMYGKTMHSERPQHRMYEQWHPLGLVGTITAFNFPVAVWAWNAPFVSNARNPCVKILRDLRRAETPSDRRRPFQLPGQQTPYAKANMFFRGSFDSACRLGTATTPHDA